MEYRYECGMSVRHVMKKTVVTSSTTMTSSESGTERMRSLIEMDVKAQPGFPRHDVKMFAIDGYSKISSESFSYKSINNNYTSVYERSVSNKIIGGGDDNRKFIEHYTKTSGRGDEQPVVVVMRERSQLHAPEWLEERKSSTTEKQDVEISNINVFLKYPSYYTPGKNETEDKVNESKIQAEVAKREKPDIPVIPDEEDEGEDEDEEDSEEEYDEFEEEFVVMEVRRKPVWHRGLEMPKPQPEKVGIPIEDLLELPTPKADQESAPEEKLIDEKIDSVERPPVVHAELPDFCILDNL